MKLIFLSGLYPPRAKGGGELSTHIIARGLVRLGHEVTVVTEGKEVRDGELDGVRVLERRIDLTAKPLFEKSWAKGQVKKMKNILDEIGKCDIVHAHDFRSAQVLSELEIDKRVATVRDYAQVCGTTHNIKEDGGRCKCTVRDILQTTRLKEASWARKPFRLWQYRYNIKFRRDAFKKISHQIFISGAQRDAIMEQQDMAGINVGVIYNPVAQEYVENPIQSGIGGQVVFAGRVEEYKGIGLLIKSWKRVAEEVPQAQLKVIGEGAQREEYEKYVEQQGLQYRVKFEGRVDWGRMMRVYDEAEILISPHIWSEPFGRTVVEAMARGKIVVAARAGGPGEIIEDGQTGWLFEPGQTGSLQRALSGALTMADIDRREMGKQARRWVEDNLHEENIARQYEDFYKSI